MRALLAKSKIRFSLLTALCLISLVSIGLGFVTAKVNAVRQAIRKIENYGGEVGIKAGPGAGDLSSTAPFLTIWNARAKLISIHFYDSVEYELPDEIFEAISQFSNVYELSLLGSDVSDEDIEKIANIHTLKRLDITATDVTKDGVARLKQKMPNTTIICVEPDAHGLIIL